MQYYSNSKHLFKSELLKDEFLYKLKMTKGGLTKGNFIRPDLTEDKTTWMVDF